MTACVGAIYRMVGLLLWVSDSHRVAEVVWLVVDLLSGRVALLVWEVALAPHLLLVASAP